VWAADPEKFRGGGFRMVAGSFPIADSLMIAIKIAIRYQAISGSYPVASKYLFVAG
jgi:hypothetical protein